jgi:hypothetical protein
MPARTKGRARFDFRGRQFVWWIDGDYWLRITSLDKRFVVAFPLGRVSEQLPTLVVHGHEFPGLTPADSRPVYLVVPEPSGSMGAWVDQILTWSFDESHELIRAEGPPRFS